MNDTYGHAAGDVVLKYVSELLKKSARTTDVIGRWGGEEFLVLLPHSTAGDALKAVEKWLADVSHKPVSIPSGESISVAFSAGVSAFKKEDASAPVNEIIDMLLARADERLYEAKHAGRACVISGD